MFVAAKRAALLYPSGNAHHFFVLLTNPHGPNRQVLMVPVCSVRYPTQDRTCILNSVDHAFIEHESFVAYSHCRLEPEAKLIRGVQSGEFVEKDAVAEQVFDRISKALFESRFAKPFAKTFCLEAGGRGFMVP